MHADIQQTKPIVLTLIVFHFVYKTDFQHLVKHWHAYQTHFSRPCWVAVSPVHAMTVAQYSSTVIRPYSESFWIIFAPGTLTSSNVICEYCATKRNITIFRRWSSDWCCAKIWNILRVVTSGSMDVWIHPVSSYFLVCFHRLVDEIWFIDLLICMSLQTFHRKSIRVHRQQQAQCKQMSPPILVYQQRQRLLQQQPRRLPPQRPRPINDQAQWCVFLRCLMLRRASVHAVRWRAHHHPVTPDIREIRRGISVAPREMAKAGLQPHIHAQPR